MMQKSESCRSRFCFQSIFLYPINKLKFTARHGELVYGTTWCMARPGIWHDLDMARLQSFETLLESTMVPLGWHSGTMPYSPLIHLPNDKKVLQFRMVHSTQASKKNKVSASITRPEHYHSYLCTFRIHCQRQGQRYLRHQPWLSCCCCCCLKEAVKAKELFERMFLGYQLNQFMRQSGQLQHQVKF
jgi:hypothetical protein